MNREEFLEIGTHCSDKSCNQLDFLPFKCPSCTLPFCQLHWRPTNHTCATYDPIKANNQIPSCPLCSQPVSFPPSTDPNTAMETHLSTSCPILFPSMKPIKSGTPICAAKKCSTKMVVPILCKECRMKFCFRHRFAGDHTCTGPVKKVVPVGVGVVGKGKGLLGNGLKRVQSIGKGSNVGASTSKTPISKAKTTPSTSKPTSKPLKGLGTKSNPIIISDDEEDEVQILSGPKKALIALKPLTKGDKRAMAEQASARRALHMRASKGLLSEDEKLKFATQQAMEAKEAEGKKSSCSVS